MNPAEALLLLKDLVAQDKFSLVNRRAIHAQAVTSTLAKCIVTQLQITDFKGHELDRDVPDEFVWIYKTYFGEVYYIKFKFMDADSRVKFISFHISD